jgi:hypothetical protein
MQPPFGHELESIESPAQFRNSLEKTISKTLMNVIESGLSEAPRRVESLQLEAAADAQGLSIESNPMISTHSENRIEQ